MTTTTQRTVADRLAAIRRMIRSLGCDPSEWDVGDLVNLVDLRNDVGDAMTRAVRALRDQGITDGEIGRVLGISQQAVSKRWPGDGRYVGAAGRYRTPRDTGDIDA